MYRGGESARTQRKTTTSLAGSAATVVLVGTANGAELAALALLDEARDSTASITLREQQFCMQPWAAVMPIIGQSEAIPLTPIGHSCSQAGAIPAAQFRLERTGCAASRPMTRNAVNESRRFTYSSDSTGKISQSNVR